MSEFSSDEIEQIEELQINLDLTFKEASIIFLEMRSESLKKKIEEKLEPNEDTKDEDHPKVEKELDLDQRLELSYQKALKEGRVIVIEEDDGSESDDIKEISWLLEGL
jgi:hypothetical protein